MKTILHVYYTCIHTIQLDTKLHLSKTSYKELTILGHCGVPLGFANEYQLYVLLAELQCTFCTLS